MENVLKAERDCVVEKLLARPGESLAVDQAIIASSSAPTTPVQGAGQVPWHGRIGPATGRD